MSLFYLRLRIHAPPTKTQLILLKNTQNTLLVNVLELFSEHLEGHQDFKFVTQKTFELDG